jgi:hypothetical protein
MGNTRSHMGRLLSTKCQCQRLRRYTLKLFFFSKKHSVVILQVREKAKTHDLVHVHSSPPSSTDDPTISTLCRPDISQPYLTTWDWDEDGLVFLSTGRFLLFFKFSSVTDGVKKNARNIYIFILFSLNLGINVQQVN